MGLHCVHQRWLYSRNQEAKKKQTKRPPAKQRATKKERTTKIKQSNVQPKNTSETNSNQESKKTTNKQPKAHKQHTEGSLEGPGRVSTGQGSFLVPGQVSHFWSLFFLWCRVNCRTFGRFFPRRRVRVALLVVFLK